MFALIVVFFSVCWLPYHLYFILVYFYPNITKHAYTRSDIIE
jgi:hypothetical protein